MKVDPIRHALSVGRFQFPIEASQATTLAAANFELNRAALERVWPRTILALPDRLPELEWLYARDGTLSARHIDQQWLADCSVPRKAAERMLARLNVNCTTGVFLAPTHAAQIRVALDHMSPRQTLIAVIPTELTSGAIIACDDFSADIAARRLWLACGPDWADEMRAIFDAHEGIAPATMMIRVPGLNAAVVDAIQKPCEALLALHAQTQRQIVSMIHGKPHATVTPPRKLLVTAGAFSLWNDAASLLGELAATCNGAAVLDTTSPTGASVLKFARLAESADAIVSANAGRSDLPSIVADNVPWITWATTTHIPPCTPVATGDRLILVDASLREKAMAAGWPASSVSVAVEPTIDLPRGVAASVSLIADLEPIVVPKAIEEMSSHRLVWDLAERELLADPLAFRGTPTAFVHACADRLGIARDSVPAALICEALVTPLFARELAKGLCRRGVKIAVYGDGWDAVPEVAAAWKGMIESTDVFRAALANTTAILDVWPASPTHRARRCGRPTVRAWGQSWSAIAGDIKSAGFVTRATSTPAPTFSFSKILG